jgi:N-acetylmuramoyl-L-alanine amidase
MSPAVFRGAGFTALACLLASCSTAADAGSRTMPLRPAAPATAVVRPPPRPATRIGSVEYVSILDAALWLGLKGGWTEPLRKLTLTSQAGPPIKVELEADSRTAMVDGLRIDMGSPTIVRSGRLYLSQIDLERCLAPLIRPAVVAVAPPHPTVIALDAGHGGVDNGMENPRLGLKEKVLALDVVMRLKRILETGGYRVVLTRTGDGALSPEKKKDLPMRAEIANRASADLFVSVHFNSLYPDTKTRGTEVYVYTPAHQRSSPGWGIGQADDSKPPQPVNRFDAWSSLLAHKLHRSVLSELKTIDRGQKTMHLAVLQDLNCPAALVESVFLSNESEARSAATPEFRQRIAEALASGIRGYVETVDALPPKSGTSATSARHRAHRSS